MGESDHCQRPKNKYELNRQKCKSTLSNYVPLAITLTKTPDEISCLCRSHFRIINIVKLGRFTHEHFQITEPDQADSGVRRLLGYFYRSSYVRSRLEHLG